MLVTMHIFGISIIAVRHELSFVQLRITLYGILGNSSFFILILLSLKWRQTVRSPLSKMIGGVLVVQG